MPAETDAEESTEGSHHGGTDAEERTEDLTTEGTENTEDLMVRITLCVVFTSPKS